MFTVVGPESADRIAPDHLYVLQDRLGRSMWGTHVHPGRELMRRNDWQSDHRALRVRLGKPAVRAETRIAANTGKYLQSVLRMVHAVLLVFV